MTSNADAGNPMAVSPDDWPREPEQRYGERQARLATRYDLDVESHMIDTDAAGRIHSRVAGDPDGEPVVLVHGVSVTATWLPLDRPYVVGNSLGSQQAFLLTIDHDRVDRLCLGGGPGGVSKEFSLLWRLLTVRGVNHFLFWFLNRGDPVENAKESVQQFLVVDDSAFPAPFYELLAASQELPGRQQSLHSLQSGQGLFGRIHSLFDLRDEIDEIERPTGFVWGSDDSLWPPEVGPRG